MNTTDNEELKKNAEPVNEAPKELSDEQTEQVTGGKDIIRELYK